MTLPRRHFLRLAAGAAAFPAASRVAWAQTYPARPVRIIVGFAAGGGVDIAARLIGQWLSERLGQSFIIENRPGAGTNIATEAVAHAPPDGYTLLLVNSANAINATLYQKLNFNFIRDIAPIAGLMRQPHVMLVNPAVPAKSIPEFIAYAKANPGKINMASAGSGTPSHLSGELFKMMTGVDLVDVPYRGVAPAMTDLLGGQVQAIFTSTGSSIAYINSNKLRPLAVTTVTRSEALPDIPTVADFVPGYEASQWYGVGTPRGTPAEVIDRLNREIDAALADPKMKVRFADLGGIAIAGSPTDFGKLIADETEKLGKVIRAAKIKPQAVKIKSTPAGLIAAIAVAALAVSPARAADYYTGKTIELVVGNYPGGGYDIYARTLGRHLGRNIPGNPTIIVKNMPGAGSAKAGHHTQVIAPKDGLTIGAVTPGAIIAPLLDDKAGSIFDPMKVTYLGTANAGPRICTTYANSKTKTFDDTLTQRTRLGGVSVGDATHDYAYLIKRTTNAQVDVVAGYRGTLDLALAMERGEIDGACGWDWSSAKAQKPEWIRDGKLHILAQLGPRESAELTRMGSPQIWKYMKDDTARQVHEMVVSPQAFTRPYFVATGTPAEHVATLRTAFDATMWDPQYLADAEKMRIDISPLPGATVQDLIRTLYATPKAIVEQARAAIRP